MSITSLGKFIYDRFPDLPEDKKVLEHLSGIYKNKKQFRAELWDKGDLIRWISLDLFYENHNRARKFLLEGRG